MNVKNLPDSALLCLSLITNRYNESLKGEEVACIIWAHCYLGYIYQWYFDNQPKAYQQILKAKDLVTKHSLDSLAHYPLEELGNLYWIQGHLQHDDDFCKEALVCHKAAFWKAVESKSYKRLPAIMTNLNYLSCYHGGLLQTAKERAAYEKFKIPSSADFKIVAGHINHGVELFSQEKYQQAIDTFRNASVESIKTDVLNKANLQIMLNDYIYHVQMKMGNYSEARNTLDQIKKLRLMGQFSACNLTHKPTFQGRHWCPALNLHEDV